MSSRERADFKNIIWLCHNCGTKIDRDAGKYPAVLLRDWKARAEKQAEYEQGRKLLDVNDICTSVAMALGNRPNVFYPNAASNVHASIVKQLEALDSRFAVTSDYINGKSIIGIHAKENVAISINVGPASRDVWHEGLRSVIDFGVPVVLPLGEVAFEGSEIFKALSKNFEEGAVKVSPVLRPAIFKLWSQDADPPILEVIPGFITLARQQCRFHGKLYGGLIEVELIFSIERGDAIRSQFALTTNVAAWEGADAQNPPFLDQFIRVIESFLDAGITYKFSFELGGHEVSRGKLYDPQSLELFREVLSYASYVRRARTVLRRIGRNAAIDTKTSFSSDEHRALANASDIAEGRERYGRSQVSGSPEMSMHCEDDGKALMERVNSLGYTTMRVLNPPGTVTIYGQNYELPQSSTYYSPIRLNIIGKTKKAEGTDFRVGIEMADNFVCQTLFDELEGSSQAIDNQLLLIPK